jgi:ATP-dependent protease HslVU (ClpYQ) peptidase subunit
MSVIACKIDNGKIYIAADSVLVRGYTKSNGLGIKHSKLFKQNGVIVGATGTLEESTLFQLYCVTRRPERPDCLSILMFISEFSDWKKTKTGSGIIENFNIVVFEGKAFLVEQWSIVEIDKFAATGAGEDFALAALHLGHSAKEAVEIACELSIMCTLPVIEFVEDVQ